MATLSDSSGQYVAMAFDEEPCAALEAAVRSGGCGLMSVELDRRPGETVGEGFAPVRGEAAVRRLQRCDGDAGSGQRLAA